jgi:hypothetical protein
VNHRLCSTADGGLVKRHVKNALTRQISAHAWHDVGPLLFDPVVASQHGDALLRPDAIEPLRASIAAVSGSSLGWTTASGCKQIAPAAGNLATEPPHEPKNADAICPPSAGCWRQTAIDRDDDSPCQPPRGRHPRQVSQSITNWGLGSGDKSRTRLPIAAQRPPLNRAGRGKRSRVSA